MSWAMVAVGGALGAVARFALGGWVARLAGPLFPWSTLAVNLLGCLLLGWLTRAIPGWSAPQELRLLLAVGFCGSFTTFSTFGYEAVALLQSGRTAAAAAYVSASAALGVAAVFAGLWLGGATT